MGRCISCRQLFRVTQAAIHHQAQIQNSRRALYRSRAREGTLTSTLRSQQYVAVEFALAWAVSWSPTAILSAQQYLPSRPPLQVDVPGVMDNLREEVFNALVRLPLAAGLGTLLALRPRRRGTPIRQPAVIQTQIVLAVV